MLLKIEDVPEKNLIGMQSRVSLSNNNTVELWRKFMPRNGEIKNKKGKEFFAMQVYDSPLFKHFTPETIFEQWACVPVTDLDIVPFGMMGFVVPDGLYAVFLHKGTTSDFPKTMQYITETWFPNSQYTWDFRPHFQIMGEKYKHDSPNSEEEVWVPIKSKQC